MYPYSMSGQDLARSAEYSQMMSGLDLLSGFAPGVPPLPVSSAEPAPTLASGLDLVSGAADFDLVSGLDLVSGALNPAMLRALPPNVQQLVRNTALRNQALQIAQLKQLVNQPRLVETPPREMKEQTQNLSRTTVNAGQLFPWTFTILGRAAKIYDLILPDSIAQFFDITAAQLGNENLFHGVGSANGETFAASAQRTGFESNTLPTGSIVSIIFQNVDAVPRQISARVKMKVVY